MLKRKAGYSLPIPNDSTCHTCHGSVSKTLLYSTLAFFWALNLGRYKLAFKKTKEHVEDYLINFKQNCKNSHKLAHHTRENAVMTNPAPS